MENQKSNNYLTTEKDYSGSKVKRIKSSSRKPRHLFDFSSAKSTSKKKRVRKRRNSASNKNRNQRILPYKNTALDKLNNSYAIDDKPYEEPINESKIFYNNLNFQPSDNVSNNHVDKPFDRPVYNQTPIEEESYMIKPIRKEAISPTKTYTISTPNPINDQYQKDLKQAYLKIDQLNEQNHQLQTESKSEVYRLEQKVSTLEIEVRRLQRREEELLNDSKLQIQSEQNLMQCKNSFIYMCIYVT